MTTRRKIYSVGPTVIMYRVHETFLELTFQGSPLIDECMNRTVLKQRSPMLTSRNDDSGITHVGQWFNDRSWTSRNSARCCKWRRNSDPLYVAVWHHLKDGKGLFQTTEFPLGFPQSSSYPDLINPLPQPVIDSPPPCLYPPRLS